jgi:DNA-directed RNA polymerase beta' subunit
MNTSQPIPSHISHVSFSHLSSFDIRALSTKRIVTSTTFDTLLNPTPGGLYTPELGQFQDNPCSTCGLKTPQCPGHCGHIELPVPVYHVTFMDQVLRLLRGTCIYCSRLRLARTEASLFVGKLRLVKYGLLKEAKDLEDVRVGTAMITTGDSDEDSDEGTDADARDLIARRERFVQQCIVEAKRDGRLRLQKTEATSNARRMIIQDFMAAITKSKKCKNCQGINPKYRKDRYVKIFRKPLSEKERVQMVQAGHIAKEAVVERKERERTEAGMKRKRQDKDEGVADLEGSSDEDAEEAGEDVASSEGEPEIAGGTLVDEAAASGKRTKKKDGSEEEYLNPSRVHAQLAQMFEREQEVLNYVYGDGTRDAQKGALSADIFFIRDVLVPPNRYRPEARTGNDEIAEAQENSLYKSILNTCDSLSQIQREIKNEQADNSRYRPRTYTDLENTWTQLQDAVNSLIDRDRNPLQGAAGRRNADGIKQKLEKKEGMFRKYMMGKRVNFAARTVISPDPNIETNEIGVPPVFAKKLTYPEAVTPWNIEDLQRCVRNGPGIWPGAVAIESETGQVVSLERKSAEDRTALANQLLAPSLTTTSGPGTRGARPKKVHRHLNSGDIVIMNRQPTLHKPSMMCHRAKVLPGEKTLRMHYANCNTYNADFDGDEMNLHFPQNELARAEALTIADTDNQYISLTAGNPLRGLIQDHISMSVWLTNRDTFFDRAEYMQLLYAAIRPESGHSTAGRILTLPPAVMKPKVLWTGKQVVSTVLLNVKRDGYEGLTMTGKSTTDKLMWGEEGKEEAEVVVKDGYLCQGILDKKQVGPSSGGLVNGVYEVFGHLTTGRFLSVLGRMLTRMLTTRAFSCGVQDLVFTKDGEENRRDALAGSEHVGLRVAAKYVGLADEEPRADDRELRRRLEDVLRDDSKQQTLDQLTSAANSDLTTGVSKVCMPGGLVKPFPKNQMQAMTSSGAKGSSVNANQISCNLGQQVLEGRRVPVMVSGKTLPCFRPFESSVRAGGYIVDRFLTGVRPQEYFFHAMAGREGLIDTAVKTSRSGYLQRCLIKGMEGLRVEYDTSVRDTTDGSIVQFLYGEDGLDVARSKYLTDFKFTAENHVSLFHNLSDEKVVEADREESERLYKHNKAAEKAYRRTNDLGASEPTISIYPPATIRSSISEKFFRDSRKYVDENPDHLIKGKHSNPNGAVGKKAFQSILDIRYLRSLVECGEAVGVVAGQSVGEPSTQMTLNTFHLAGHSAKNVTLGIPRLREIVMTAAARIATPMMTLRLNDGLSAEDGRKFGKGISRLSLAEVVDRVTITEATGKGDAYEDARKFEVKIEFFPKEEYMKEYAITVEDLVNTIEWRFLPALQKAVRREIKKRGDEGSLKAAVGKSVGRVEEESGRPEGEREGGDDDSDSEGEDEAARDRKKNNRGQGGYEAMEDDEEIDMARVNQREDEEPNEEEMEDEAYGGSPHPTPDPEDQQHDSARSAAKDRENRIKGDRKTNDITSFSFSDGTGDICTFTMEYDASTAKILMLHLVESALRSALIQSVAGITTCSLDEKSLKDNPDNPPILIASGTNIRAMWEYQHIIHPHHIYTNSIHDILLCYGVEAARAAILKELQAVFGGHGISVDPRHLQLIAEYMTRDGVYQAFSRMGYRGNVSPFMKMSFETTVGFLRDAVLEGEVEGLKGPSARIVVGNVGGVGTGGIDVFMPVEEGEVVEETQ